MRTILKPSVLLLQLFYKLNIVLNKMLKIVIKNPGGLPLLVAIKQLLKHAEYMK